MDWDSPSGILTPILMMIGAVILFNLLEILNALKLNIMGHSTIVQISRAKIHQN